jgi:hypothetical protein
MMAYLSHPVVVFLGYLLGLIGVLATIFAYIKQRRVKRLSYSVQSTSFIRDYKSTIPRLDVTYDGRTIQNLTITTFLIWNSGTETIDNADIANADPLQFIPDEDSTILYCEVAAMSLPANRVSITSNKLSFDYLDKDEGAVVKILHTGISSSVQFFGTLKGTTVRSQKLVRAKFQLQKQFYFIIPASISSFVFGALSMQDNTSKYRYAIGLILLSLGLCSCISISMLTLFSLKGKAVSSHLIGFFKDS